MDDPIDSRSRSMAAFADIHGEPDAETTLRLRGALCVRLHERSIRARRTRHWLQASAVTAVALAAVTTWMWQRGWLTDDTGFGVAAVIHSAEHGRIIERAWGSLELAPRTLVRLDESDAEHAVELVDGELELRAAAATPPVVRIGGYEVEQLPPDTGTAAADMAGFSVRRTPGVPLVTVHVGRVRVSGPDLPAAGVIMTASPS